MRTALLFCLCAAAATHALASPDDEFNVNSRYTVERVDMPMRFVAKIGGELRRQIDSVVGTSLDSHRLERLAALIRAELRVERVSVQIQRGSRPNHVAVKFEVESGREHRLDVDIPKLTYHSSQGWSAAGDLAVRTADLVAGAGLVSDGDQLSERYTGVRLRIEHLAVGTPRLRLKVEYDRYQERGRSVIAPSATVQVTPELSASFGADIEHFKPAGANLPVAANALTAALRYRHGWESQAIEASYALRAAAAALASDFSYTRHTARIRYGWTQGRQKISSAVIAGLIVGDAPFYERLVAGNTTTLRGWNKADIDPLGGDRLLHASVDYQYRFLTVFYDTGVVWTSGTSSGEKHSAGFGYRSEGKEGLMIAVAFPLRNGRMDPVLIAGFNF